MAKICGEHVTTSTGQGHQPRTDLAGKSHFLVYAAGVVLMASPVVCAGVAIAAFVTSSRGRRQ